MATITYRGVKINIIKTNNKFYPYQAQASDGFGDVEATTKTKAVSSMKRKIKRIVRQEKVWKPVNQQFSGAEAVMAMEMGMK